MIKTNICIGKYANFQIFVTPWHTHTHSAECRQRKTMRIPEAHTEPQEATRAGNVGNPTHLFRLSKPLAVRLLSS